MEDAKNGMEDFKNGIFHDSDLVTDIVSTVFACSMLVLECCIFADQNPTNCILHFIDIESHSDTLTLYSKWIDYW